MGQQLINLGTEDTKYSWFIVRAKLKVNDVRAALYTVNLLAACVDDATYLASNGFPTGTEITRVSLIGSVEQYAEYVGYTIYDASMEMPRYSVCYAEIVGDGLASDTEELK